MGGYYLWFYVNGDKFTHYVGSSIDLNTRLGRSYFNPSDKYKKSGNSIIIRHILKYGHSSFIQVIFNFYGSKSICKGNDLFINRETQLISITKVIPGSMNIKNYASNTRPNEPKGFVYKNISNQLIELKEGPFLF